METIQSEHQNRQERAFKQPDPIINVQLLKQAPSMSSTELQALRPVAKKPLTKLKQLILSVACATVLKLVQQVAFTLVIEVNYGAHCLEKVFMNENISYGRTGIQ